MDVENIIISHSVWLKVLLQLCPHEVFIQWHFDGPGTYLCKLRATTDICSTLQTGSKQCKVEAAQLTLP